MDRNTKLSKSQINRKFIDSLGLHNVSVKKFRDRVLPNISSTSEIRGMPHMRSKQRHTQVYRVGDMIDYIVSESKKLKKK